MHRSIWHLQSCQRFLFFKKKNLVSWLSRILTFPFSFKRKGSVADFYKNALLFLAYANIEKIPTDERKQFALYLVVAALVGENVYSFGELVWGSYLIFSLF